MKILLIDPPNASQRAGQGPAQVLPLGLASVAAMVTPMHEVRLLVSDACASPDEVIWTIVRRAIEDEAPDLIGVGATSPTLPAAARVAAMSKELAPARPVVLGGVHPTLDPIGSLAAAPGVDWLVLGEGELPFAALGDAIEDGRLDDARRTPGVAWRGERGELHLNPPERPPDPDHLPFPLRDRLVGAGAPHASLFQGVLTARGCPFDCSYCAAPTLSGRRVRFRSVDHVMAELRALVEDHGIRELFFHDSVFTLDRRRTLALTERLAPLGLRFTCQTRVDRVDPEICAALARAGCQQIMLGIESGAEETLARVGKPTPRKPIQRAVRQVRAAGIRAAAFFMIGFPWETRAHIKATRALATRLKLDAAHLFSAAPLPGTRLWDEAGCPPIPPELDFRTPGWNLTAIPDEEYAALFEDVKRALERSTRG